MLDCHGERILAAIHVLESCVDPAKKKKLLFLECWLGIL